MSVNYNPQIFTKDMVLCLDAANPVSLLPSSGTWTDLSKEKNTGNLTNGASYSSENLGAIQFDGTNDYVNLQNKLLWNSFGDKLTVEVFFKLEGGVGNYPRIVAKQSTGLTTATSCFQIGILNNSAFRWSVRTSNGSIDASASSVSQGVNYHFVGTYDGTAMKAYVNGEEIINRSLTGNILTSAQPLTLGLTYFDRTVNYGFPGKLYAVKMYKAALTQNQVKQNFYALRGRYEI